MRRIEAGRRIGIGDRGRNPPSHPPPPPAAGAPTSPPNDYNTCRINGGMAGRSTMAIDPARSGAVRRGPARSGAGERPPYLRSLGGLEECARAIEGMLGGDPDSQISMLPLVSGEDIVEAIQRAGPRVKIEKKGGAPPNRTVSLMVTGSSEARSGRLLIVQADIPEVYLAITHEKPSFVSTLTPMLEKMYPHVFVPHFSSIEIQSIMGMLESKTGMTLTTRRIIAHKRIDKKMSYMRKSKRLKASRDARESAIIHTGVPYRESIESALEDDQWIDKAQFVLSEGDDVRLEGHFSRNGLFKFRHSFMIFKNHVLPHVLGLSARRFKVCSNRSREDNGGEVSPLVINLGRYIFNDREENHRFIEAVQGLKYASCGVYHANPYVNISLVDHIDGSAFKIWVMSPDKITIVPQIRASQASLSRVIDHIFEKFGEGEILEYK